jgi:hypothetical protein
LGFCLSLFIVIVFLVLFVMPIVLMFFVVLVLFSAFMPFVFVIIGGTPVGGATGKNGRDCGQETEAFEELDSIHSILSFL